MLASVYSYRVMVKSVSSCYVRGRRVLSNPITYIELGAAGRFLKNDYFCFFSIDGEVLISTKFL